MFLTRLAVERITREGAIVPVPIAHLDNFAMRNFTNDAVFDDTLPIADGVMEAGLTVPIERLRTAMQSWFDRKRYVSAGDSLRITEVPRP